MAEPRGRELSSTSQENFGKIDFFLFQRNFCEKKFFGSRTLKFWPMDDPFDWILNSADPWVIPGVKNLVL